MAEMVWVSHADALKVVEDCPWGRLKEPNVVRTVNLLDSMAISFTREKAVYGMSDIDKALLKYKFFLRKTLDSFCEANPIACRKAGELHEIEETALRRFLEEALNEEIGDQFGNIPNYKVT